MMLSAGARIENVSKMLGHRKITQTQRYAKLMAVDVYGQFDKVDAEIQSRRNERSDDAMELPDNKRGKKKKQ